MSLALLLFLTSLSNVHGVWNWTHPVQEAFLADGILMTSNHMKFKRLKETYDAVGHFFSKENSTQLMCANECIECQRCVTFGFKPSDSDANSRCRLYDFRLVANPDDVIYGADTTSRFFEIEVIALSPFLC